MRDDMVGNVPELRFPEFDGDWEDKRLGEVSELKNGYSFSSKEYLSDGFYKIITISNVQSGKMIVSDNTKEIKTAPCNIRSHQYLNVGEILISMTGNVGRVCLVSENDCLLNQRVGKIVPNSISHEFLYQVLSYTKFLKSMEAKAQGAAQGNIGTPDIMSYSFNCPNNRSEQQKTADFLTTVDKRIAQLEEKKRMLTEYKKGVMQQIFSQQIRFTDDAGNSYPDWEEKRLGDVGNTYNGLTGKTKEHFGEGKPFITYKQIFDSSYLNLSKCGLVSISEGERQKLAAYGDVFFTTSSETPHEVGFTSVLLDEVGELYLNSFCFGYRMNSLKELSPEFARFLFRSPMVRKSIARLAQGSTRYNMSKVQLMNVKVHTPCEEEQQKIADFLTSIDNKIEQVGAQLEQAKTFKKGLLQQMFV